MAKLKASAQIAIWDADSLRAVVSHSTAQQLRAGDIKQGDSVRLTSKNLADRSDVSRTVRRADGGVIELASAFPVEPREGDYFIVEGDA